MKRRHVPGLSVLVLQDGKVIKEKGYGLANVEDKVPVTPQTVITLFHDRANGAITFTDSL